MTETVASPTESRAAQRFKTLSDTAALLGSLSSERLGDDLPSDMAQKLLSPRFRKRLERRFLLRTGVHDALPDLINSPAGKVISLGDAGLRDMIVDSGIMCHFAALRQIVDQVALKDLSTRLGLSLAAHDARRAVQGVSLDHASRITSRHPVGENDDELIEAILKDGLQCWCCWIHGQSIVLRDFFQALTPPTLYDGDYVATEGCCAKDCQHRAALFADRLSLTLAEHGEQAENDEPVRKEA